MIGSKLDDSVAIHHAEMLKVLYSRDYLSQEQFAIL
jgi:hypothetical protein